MKHIIRRALSALLAFVMALTVILPVAIPSVGAMDLAEYEQKTYYKNGASPMAAKPTTVPLSTGKAPTQSEVNYALSLDGTWKMTSTGKVSDLAAGKEWSVKVTAYGEDLSVVKTQTFTGKGSVGTSGKAGDFALTAEETDNTPLTVTFDLYVGGQYRNRTFVYFNYEYKPGSLFYLPRTSLSYSVSGNTVTVKNTGELPALGVELTAKDTAKFVTSDNFFFLASGETVTVTVNDGGLVEGVTCFNLKNTADKVAPTIPEGIEIGDVAFDQATVSWDPSTDEGGLFGYTVTLTDKDGKATEYFAQDGDRSILLKGLAEVSKYSVTVEAVDNGGNRSGASAAKSFTTLPDRSRPALNPIW